MRKILKVIDEEAHQHDIKPQRMFEIFVEMQYVFVNAWVVESKYSEYSESVSKITTSYLNELKKHRYRDVLGEVMGKIYALKNSSKSKYCQHLTPTAIADSVAQMLCVEKDEYFVGDIASGTGATTLALQKELSNQCNDKHIKILMNDLDSYVSKVAVIQQEYTQMFHNKFSTFYLNYNHDVIKEWKHFATQGITDNTKIIGCTERSFITNDVVKRALSSPDHIEGKLLMDSFQSVRELNHYLSTGEV
ncbi:hypothetical protein KS670_003397 [Vibrio parahaemolyticus]|nr:hypothetical protein [Vibrio parahaemolyticus]